MSNVVTTITIDLGEGEKEYLPEQAERRLYELMKKVQRTRDNYPFEAGPHNGDWFLRRPQTIVRAEDGGESLLIGFNAKESPKATWVTYTRDEALSLANGILAIAEQD